MKECLGLFMTNMVWITLIVAMAVLVWKNLKIYADYWVKNKFAENELKRKLSIWIYESEERNKKFTTEKIAEYDAAIKDLNSKVDKYLSTTGYWKKIESKK